MRILFLTSEAPHPADSGGAIKTASILAYLRRRHEVHVLCFRRRPLSDEQVRWAADAGSVETVPLKRGRSPLNLLRSYVDRVPLSIERNRSPLMRKLVEGRLRTGGYDSLFVDGWLMAQYVPAWYAGPAALHEHNAEHVLWRRQADLEGNPLRHALVRREYRRVRAYEAAILRRFQVVFAVSGADRQALLALGAGPQRVRLLPNLPDPALLERPGLSFAAAGPVVLYFGTLSWQPNLEGLDHLLRSVFPLVRQRAPEARLVIAGKGAPPWLRRLAERTQGVEFLGEVEDAEPHYRRARVFVEASRSGGGTRLKVLNALARGLPVVASPQAAEGLEVTPGEHLLVAGDAVAMADAITRLLGDEAQWRALSERGRELVRRRYVASVAYGALDEPFQTDVETVEVLGLRFHNLSRSEAARAIAEMVQAGKRGYVVKPYSEFMPRAVGNSRLRGVLNGADLCLADGVGILWAAHYLSLSGGRARALLQFPLSLAAVVFNPASVRNVIRENMAGVDLTWEVLARLDEIGAKVFLLGGTEAEIRGAREAIERRFGGLRPDGRPSGRVVGARHGYFDVTGEENEQVVEAINAAGAQALLVAMGFPRQEEWIAANWPRLRVNVAVAEGGSFSFISGATRRAPRWMRRTGLEWLFRLLRQPGRIRRQMAIPRFLWLVFKERMGRAPV